MEKDAHSTTAVAIESEFEIPRSLFVTMDTVSRTLVERPGYTHCVKTSLLPPST